jgi:hypothetical protein
MKMWAEPAYTARAWLDYAVDSFDTLYAENTPGARMLSVGVHLRIIGRPGRSWAFDRLLQHVGAKPDVWIATRRQIAEHFARTCPYDGGVR